MDRRAFLRLIGIGLAAGPLAIEEVMKPRIFYSIPAASPQGWPFNLVQEAAKFDAVLRQVYEGSIRELFAQPSTLHRFWDDALLVG